MRGENVGARGVGVVGVGGVGSVGGGWWAWERVGGDAKM